MGLTENGKRKTENGERKTNSAFCILHFALFHHFRGEMREMAEMSEIVKWERER